MPDRLYDDADELARWARAAHGVALRAAGKPKKKSPRSNGEESRAAQATFAGETESTATHSGSVSHMTRLRPQRFAE